MLQVTTLLCCLLLTFAAAKPDTGCPSPWETRRGDACYGRVPSYQHPYKNWGSDWVRVSGDLVYTVVHPGLPYNGSIPTDGYTLTRQVFYNMLQLIELAGGSKYDILRNPVRANDTATLTNDPNNALVFRSGLANITEIIYNLKLNGNPAAGPSYQIYPSVGINDLPGGRSFVIILQGNQITMDVTAFLGSNSRCTHDASNGTRCFDFNQLPFNWTMLPVSDQQYIANHGYCLPNGTCYHYSAPTSLSYNPKFELCEDDPLGEAQGKKFKNCRYYMLRSCERGFGPRVQDEALTIRNAVGLVTGGVLNWKGNYYNCTDVVNYNNAGALWCRIRDDVHIPIANEIVWSHHSNAARMLNFQPSDDVLLDFFYTQPDLQHPLNMQQCSTRYTPGKWPAIVPQNGRLVGGDKQELTGEHITGEKFYSSQDPARRVTVASLEGWNSIRVGSDGYATTQTAHTCNATVCRLPSSLEQIARQSFENAFAELASIGHDYQPSVTKIHVIVTEDTYRSYLPIVKSLIEEYWPEVESRPVFLYEPHIRVWPYASNIAGRVVEGPNNFSVFLRSSQRVPSRF